MKNIILHHHFFKNAGSTLMVSLERGLGEGFVEFHPSGQEEGLFTDDDLRSVLENEKVVAVSSHHFAGTDYNRRGTFASDYLFYDFILVRHPLKRLFSTWSYYQTLEESDYPVAQVAKANTLPEFLKYMIRNYPGHLLSPQVCMLAGGGALPPLYRHLDAAIERLMNCAVCGTADSYADTMIAAEYFLMPVFPSLRLHYSVVNVSQPIPGYDGSLESIERVLGKELYGDLTRMSELDIELCKAAEFEVRRRKRYIPHFEELKRDFTLRCEALNQ